MIQYGEAYHCDCQYRWVWDVGKPLQVWFSSKSGDIDPNSCDVESYQTIQP
jgi:hypothetical protein